MKKLENKTAIVTGAASGMGRAISILFAGEGANVILADLKQNELDPVIDVIRKSGGKAESAICNVAVENDVKAVIDFALGKFGAIDILVNNAGVMDDFMPVHEVSDDLWNRVLQVNLYGPMYACRVAIPHMMKQGAGNIINIASVGGLYGARAGAAYTASKHALVGLTKNMAFMYAQKGIRCNAIAPGGVNTNIGKNMKPNAFGSERCMLGMGTMPRAGEAEEIANTALFLASSDSNLISGAVLTADAGWTAY